MLQAMLQENSRRESALFFWKSAKTEREKCCLQAACDFGALGFLPKRQDFRARIKIQTEPKKQKRSEK